MQKSFLRKLLIAAVTALAVTLSPLATAQIVSSGMTGVVRGSDGKALAGASVTAVHTPTNSTYTATTNESGRFSFRSLPVGGPYTVSANQDGYTAGSRDGITTQLGSDVDVGLTLKSEILELEKFVTTGTANDLNANATGSGMFMSNDQLEAKPTAQRSLADLISASPLVTLRATIGDREESQISAVGQNNRYNSIMIDGAKINDQFGLNMTGLASFFNPLSIDTIEQLSVQISPYDVRQAGFTGATINAVTKSGTNKFKGSAYYIFGGDELEGVQMTGEDVIDRIVLGNKVVPKSERTTKGFTLGGPIWKDRLFFFLNYEKFTLSAPPNNPGLTAINDADMTAFISRLAQYNTASGQTIPWGESLAGATISNMVSDEKKLAKVDWRINDDHRLSVRYSTTDGELPQYGKYQGGVFIPPANGAADLRPTVDGSTALSTHTYSQVRKEEVWATQLFSTWTPDLTTELKYSQVSQDQDTPLQVVAPEITVFSMRGTDRNGVATNNAAYVAGTEFSRQGNQIYVDSQNMSGTADYVWRNMVFTAGFEREESRFYNIFRNGSYGTIAFRNLNDFINDRPYYLDRVVYDPAKRPDLADISDFATNGLFAQAKWDVNPRLTVYGGIRYEFAETEQPPPLNTAFLAATGFNNTGTVDGVKTVSPRVAFNYAVNDERTIQVRGGIGHFLGRAPWVIFSNSYNNPGVGTFNTLTRAPANGTLAQGTFTTFLSNFDVENPYGTGTDVGATRQVDWIDDGIKLPSVWRGNLAIDHKLEGLGATVTAELVYTKNDETLFIVHENLLPLNAPSADGRARFSGAPTGTAANSRFTGYNSLFHVTNASVGSSTYMSLAIDRPMRDGWAYNASYTHGKATDAQSFGQTTASGQWQRNVVFNQSTVEEHTSDFEVEHRIQIALARQFEFLKGWRSTASLYYEGRSGAPYSWVYSSDLNGDSQNANDAVAVPSGASDPRFNFSRMSSAQVDAYLAFMNTSGLAKYAGSYAPKNTFKTPWVNRLDLKLSQRIPIYKPAELELFLDFINFGSFINEDLFGGYVVNANQAHFGSQMFRTNRLGPAVYDTDGRILPQQSTLTGNGANVVAFNPDQFVFEEGQSRWRIQIGARLRF
jgi:hypothetical protein